MLLLCKAVLSLARLYILMNTEEGSRHNVACFSSQSRGATSISYAMPRKRFAFPRRHEDIIGICLWPDAFGLTITGTNAQPRMKQSFNDGLCRYWVPLGHVRSSDDSEVEDSSDSNGANPLIVAENQNVAMVKGSSVQENRKKSGGSVSTQGAIAIALLVFGVLQGHKNTANAVGPSKIRHSVPWRGKWRTEGRAILTLINSYSKQSATDKLRSTPASVINLSGLSVSTAMVVTVTLIMRLFGLPALSAEFIKAAGRMSLQLFIVGSILLDRLFGASKPYTVLCWLLFMGVMASKEAASRMSYVYGKMFQHCAAAMAGGVFTTLAITTLAVLRMNNPWWEARTLVPIAGMLFGNSLSAISLGMNTLLKEFAEGRDKIERRLAHGATYWEASVPVVRNALATSLTPTINAMASTGLVFLPGMMTGQILGGQAPSKAAAYQIMIYFSISTSSCLAALILTYLAIHTLMDCRNHRLAPDQLTKLKNTHEGAKMKSEGKEKAVDAQLGNDNPQDSLHQSQSIVLTERFNDTARSSTDKNARITSVFVNQNVDESEELSKSRFDNENSVMTLQVRQLDIPYTNIEKISFDLQSKTGRLGIIGRSGIGKSQLLRTVAQLAEARKGLSKEDAIETTARDIPCSMLTLNGVSYSSMPAYVWRTNVLWVSQDRSTLPGSPMNFLKETLKYKSRNRHSHYFNTKNQHGAEDAIVEDGYHWCDFASVASKAIELGRQWNLPHTDIWNREWNTLSGGEAQRISLAIALALQPKVLLLDEPTSACDTSTTLQMEQSLLEENIPFLLVSHDPKQIARLCTDALFLDR